MNDSVNTEYFLICPYNLFDSLKKSPITLVFRSCFNPDRLDEWARNLKKLRESFSCKDNERYERS